MVRKESAVLFAVGRFAVLNRGAKHVFIVTIANNKIFSRAKQENNSSRDRKQKQR